MHEVSIAERLVELIQEAGRNQGFARVLRIRVSLGALGHVEADSLRFCFDVVSRGTIADGACLDLRTIAAEGRCASCGRTVKMAERYDLCPECGNGHLEMIAGDELRLTELEVE